MKRLMVAALLSILPVLASASVIYEFVEDTTGSILGKLGISSAVASADSGWSTTNAADIDFFEFDFGADGGVLRLGDHFEVSDIGLFSLVSDVGTELDAGDIEVFTGPLEMIPGVDELQARFRRSPLLDEVSLESRDPFRTGHWQLTTVSEPSILLLLIAGITCFFVFRGLPVTKTRLL